jgi:hypothetical protein
VLDPVRRFFNLQPTPDGSCSRWRRWLILSGVGFFGLLLGAGIGAGGKANTATVTVARGVTTVHAGTHTVTRTIVHIHVHTRTVTQTVTAPTAEPPSGAAAETDEVGSASHAGDTKFCEEHSCIGSFATEEGTVVECSDGTYSHAGGISGACSSHGGEASGSSEPEEESHE